MIGSVPESTLDARQKIELSKLCGDVFLSLHPDFRSNSVTLESVRRMKTYELRAFDIKGIENDLFAAGVPTGFVEDLYLDVYAGAAYSVSFKKMAALFKRYKDLEKYIVVNSKDKAPNKTIADNVVELITNLQDQVAALNLAIDAIDSSLRDSVLLIRDDHKKAELLSSKAIKTAIRNDRQSLKRSLESVLSGGCHA